MLGSGSQYGGAGLAIDDISITGTFVPDTAPFGVTLAQTGESTDVVEGGAGDTYSLVLDTQPTANVFIDISQTDPDVTASPAQLIFTTSNWETPQDIAVTAVNDTAHELLHTGTITHTVAGTSASEYLGLSVDSLVVNVTDDDNFTPTAFAGPDQIIDLTQVGGDPVAGAYYEWDAASDSVGDNVWNSTTANAYNWQFDSGSLTPVNVSDARFGSLTKAYGFPTAKDASNNSFDAVGSNQPATFEFVLDVDGADGSIFETGGSGDGLQVDVVGGVLRGTVQEATPAQVSYTLTPTDMGRFIHVVFVVDSASDVVQLYVDGALQDSAAWIGPDWSGTDAGALGAQAGTMPTGGSTAEFSGKMALFRYYSNKAFTGADVTTNYDSIAGTGATATLDGSATDGDSDPLTTEWTVRGVAPGNVTFADASTAVTTATFDAPGTYILRLTATDDIDVAFDECEITVNEPTPYSIDLVESAGSTVVSEVGATDSYTLVLGAEPSDNVTINIAGDDDVSVFPTIVTFTPSTWDQAQTITVTAVDDGFVEGNHTGTTTHIVTSNDGNYSGLAVPNVVASIADDDDPGAISLASTAASLGESDGSIMLTVSRSGGNKGEARVSYATSNGTATAGSDYTASSGTLIWADGNSADQTITINISSDLDPESDKTFTVNLSSEVGASLSTPSSTTVTIIDDDEPGSLALTSSTYSFGESDGTGQLTVTRTGGSAGSVSVDYTIADGTAVAGLDFTVTAGSTGTLNWSAGDSANKFIEIQIISDDVSELDKTFSVTLSNASVASMGSLSSATVTITDDDFSPSTITGLVGWYDAQKFPAATAIGSDLASWPDQTGGSNTTANNLIQYTSLGGSTAVKPKLQEVTLNGDTYKSVRFLPGLSKEYELLQATGLVAASDTDRTVITVYKGGNNDPLSRPVSFGSEVAKTSANSSNFWVFATDGNGSMYFGKKGQDNRLINSQSAGLNRTDVLIRTSVMNTANSYDEYIDVLDPEFADNQVLSNGNPDVTITPTPEGNFYVGDTTVTGGAGQPTFDVLEIFVFDKVLTDSERVNLQDYLKDKYTLSEPTVTLAVDNASVAEASGTSTITATLSAAYSSDVTVDLIYSGTATGGGTDYTVSPASITITAGDTTGSATLTAAQDSLNEGDETIIVDIASVINGTESGTQQQTVTITDDDSQSAYEIWSGGVAFDADSNNDGVTNGMAWVLGASDPSQIATSLLPTIDSSTVPGYIIFTYRRSDEANANANTTIAAQYGTSLSSWTTAVGGANVTITSVDDDYGSGVDKVEVKISKTLSADGKIFGRLSVGSSP